MTGSKIYRSWEGRRPSSDTFNVDEQIQERYLGTTVAPKKRFEGDHEAGAALLNILYLLARQMVKERQEIIGISKGANYLLRQPPGKLNPMTRHPGSKYFFDEFI